MKRSILAILFSGYMMFIFFPVLAGASSFLPECNPNNPSGTASNTSVCQDVQTQASGGGNAVIRLIIDAINIISFLVGVAAIIIIIISGIRLVTSGGGSNAVAGAKSGIIAAVVGIVVVVLAQTIVIFVLNNIK